MCQPVVPEVFFRPAENRNRSRLIGESTNRDVVLPRTSSIDTLNTPCHSEIAQAVSRNSDIIFIRDFYHELK